MYTHRDSRRPTLTRIKSTILAEVERAKPTSPDLEKMCEEYRPTSVLKYEKGMEWYITALAEATAAPDTPLFKLSPCARSGVQVFYRTEDGKMATVYFTTEKEKTLAYMDTAHPRCHGGFYAPEWYSLRVVPEGAELWYVTPFCDSTGSEMVRI